MLKPQDRLYFIHIPKTAGTTLIPHLDARFHAAEICPAQLWPELLRLPQEELPRYRLFRGHFGAKGLDSFLPEPPLRITMLRHPVPLALSTYKFILREPGTPEHRLVKKQKMSFADFLRHPKARLAVSNKQVRNLSFELRYQPSAGATLAAVRSANRWVNRHKIMLGSPKEQLDRALAVLQECAFFGLVERFDESMALLSWTFAWPPVRQVQKLMVAPPAPPGLLSSAPAQLQAQIEACNKLDWSLYQAGEQLFGERMAVMMEGLKCYAREGEKMPESFSEDPEFIHELLERRYQHHAEHLYPPTTRARVTFAEPLQGSGWHRREKALHDDTFYRWSGPGRVSTLEIAVATDKDLIVTFLVLDAASKGILESLELTVNGQPVMLHPIVQRTFVPRYYRAFIPRGCLPARAGNIRLAFQVAKTMIPEPPYWDPRSVGIAINEVEICPLPEAPPETVLAARLKRVRRPRRWRHWLLQIPCLGPWLRTLYLYWRAAFLSKIW